uniref:N-acetyllactosaminide beta-1,3-N-acetylglucosaminyltransferase n=1 Tax=Rhabditophanes sp. KR3021 TaxID=114890 RepID=A0AC35THX8_9BILA
MVCLSFGSKDLKKVNGLTVFDKTYIYTSDIFNTTKKNAADRITKVVTCSSLYLKPTFKESVTNWNGPMILGVLIDDNELVGKQASCAYCTLKRMGNGILNNLQIHFIYKQQHPFYSNDKIIHTLSVLNCSSMYSFNLYCTPDKISYNQKIINAGKFPINVLRNIMKEEVQTNFMILTDLDHFYSVNFERKMSLVAKRVLKKGTKYALVMRMFEVSSKVKKSSVKNKRMLWKLMRNKKASELHDSWYPLGHKIPRLKEWFKHKRTSVPTIQFTHPYKVVEWEPQIITRKEIPDYYDMPYPLHSNTSHRRELCRAGFKFVIVNDVFAYHRGFKSKRESYFVKAVTNKHIKSDTFNRDSMAFEERLDRMYPKTHSLCPRWTQRL